MTDAIWQSVRNYVKIADEAEALLSVFDLAIASHSFGRFEIDAEDWNHDWRMEGHDWCTLCYVRNYPVQERLKRLASRGLMAIGVSFYRREEDKGDAWPGAQRAKLYAGFAPTARAWDATTLCVNGNGEPVMGERLSNALWGVRAKTGTIVGWYFAVALEAIESQEDFAREVLTPMSMLLNGESEEKAFAEATAILTGS